MNIPFNHHWLFHEIFEENMKYENYNTTHMQSVTIPHTCAQTPYQYFDEDLYQLVCGYRNTLFAPIAWKNSRVYLTFEGVLHIATVFVNGTLVGTHHCGYTAFSLDITDALIYDGDNIIAICVDSRESNNVPPFGHVIDFMTYGGIYRDISIEIKPNLHIIDTFVETTSVESEKKQLNLTTTLSHLKEDLTLVYSLAPVTESSLTYEQFATSIVTKETTTLSHSFSHIHLWDIENPYLYWVKIELFEKNKLIHTKEIRFGFREAIFRSDGFYLNGKKVKIIGLNRHQSYPYVGYAMPKRVQQLDADILKNELCVNGVRTSHYPQSQHFIHRCDELGLLVFTEIVGWQYVGDDDWKAIALKTTEEMVMQYRNHPSIILWGVRINESGDDDSFYQKTNDIAHQLDPTRATGGVRFITKSSLLEDVYTFNDFSHTGNNPGTQPKKNITSDMSKPYLVAEYNGHMFPTKSFDTESHRLEHGLRHARVVDSIYGDPEIAGGFGWCMFDYNTHKDFGSGDRICHHGVMTMFRNPKLAASLYASQTHDTPILEISSCMGIGDYPGGNLGPIYAFTNADSLKVYKNGNFVNEFYPLPDSYPNLPHPPIIIDDLIGNLMEAEGYSAKNIKRIKETLLAISKYGQNDLPLTYKIKMLLAMRQEKLTMDDGIRLYSKYVGNWGDQSTEYTFEGIKNGQVVSIVTKKAMKKISLKVTVDTSILEEKETYDVATIRIQAVDDHNQLLPYYHGTLTFTVSGALSLIGPSTVSMQGGSTGTYVRSRGINGKGTLTISTDFLEPITLDFSIITNHDNQ